MAEREERPGRRRAWPVWPLLFFLSLSAISAFLHIAKSSRRDKIQAAKERLAATVRSLPVEEVKARRARFYQARYYLGYPTRLSFAVAGFIRRLAGAFRPGQVLGLRIDPGVHDFRFQLTVGIGTGDSSSALWRFAALYEGLRNFPEVFDLSFTEKGPAGSGKLHVFTVSGRAELP